MEERAREFTAGERLALRVMEKLRGYLEKIRGELLPKSAATVAAVLLNFIATCKRCSVEPFAWFRDILTRIATHPVNRLTELLPHNWKVLAASQT